MALPINIEDLIKGNTVEWERIEFKSGWNPETIIHTMVLWCPAGDNRMYSAPITLGTKAQRQPYIRVGSESIVAREYRNRRIGDFLKELQLTEGRGTGFPAIYDALEANGSPKPVFETDDDSTYFLATIPAHILADQTFIKPNINLDIKLSFNTIDDLINFTNQVSDLLNRKVHNRVQEMLILLQKRIPRTELFEMMGLKNHSDNRLKYLDPLLSYGWVEMEFPDKRTSPKQTYKISKTGRQVLLLLGRK